jgi:hypothetical protein
MKRSGRRNLAVSNFKLKVSKFLFYPPKPVKAKEDLSSRPVKAKENLFVI